MAININHPENKITTTSGELNVDDTLNIKDLKVGDLPVIDDQGNWVGPTVSAYTGSRGVTGFTGSIAYTGSRGYTGSRSYTGSRGFTGYAGSRAYTGSRGFIGYTGSRAYTGSRGFIGYTGSKGIIGYTGSKGIIGYTGSKGIIGYTGSQGIIGYTGSRPQISSSDTQIIYNNAGTISGAPQLTYNTATNTTTIGTTIVTNSATFNSSIIEKVFTISGSTPTILASNGTIQLWNLTANSTPTLSLNSGEYITLMISDGTAFTITWSGVTWVGGTTPTLPTTGSAVIELWKVSTITYGAYIGNVA